MRFESSFYLLLVLILPLFILKWRLRVRSDPSFRYSDLTRVRARARSWGEAVLRALFPLRIFLLAMMVLALARPQDGESYEDYLTQGIDIMLAVDASGSMRAEDFYPKNRLEVSKEKMKEFIRGRRGDRIGMVVFGEEAFTLCPLTLDDDFLLKRVEALKLGMVPEEKTAIGTALATSLARLRDSQAKSKVIILLTDGMNNAGKVDPATAAEMAKALNVKIHTIGIGKEGYARVPVRDPMMGVSYARMKTEIDENTLREISGQTGGLYFRAESEEGLSEIYKTIDQMEKTSVEVKVYADYRELFPYLLWPAFLLFLLERLLARTALRVLP